MSVGWKLDCGVMVIILMEWFLAELWRTLIQHQLFG